MDLPVKPIRNCTNFARFNQLYVESGCNTIVQSLFWLSNEDTKIGDKLYVLFTTTKKKLKLMNGAEKKLVEKLKNNYCKLSDFDITFLYKIIQNMDGLNLEPCNNDVWNQNCPSNQRHELEHLLYRLKDGRNKVAHPSDKEKDLSDADVDDKCNDMKDLLTSILLEVGKRSNKDDKTIKEKIDYIQAQIERIRKGEIMDESLKRSVIKLILEDLNEKYRTEIELASDNELKWYLPPNLYAFEDETENIDTAFDELKVYSPAFLQLKEAMATKIPVCDILMASGESQVIEVLGAAKMGKTALTKYLHHSWLSGYTELVNGLETFDVVLRIECRKVNSRDASQYLENLFTTARYSFSNNVSLKKQLDEFKVLWIMDGYDECTAEFTGLLEDVLKSFPSGHKCIITSRLDQQEEFAKKFLSKMNVKTLRLENLSGSNFEGLLSNWTQQEEAVAKFRAFHNSLQSQEKQFLQVPLHMSMIVKLWMENPDDAVGSCNPISLYWKSTDLQLKKLIERLEGRTFFNLHDDLTRVVNKWFYGSICKQIFYMVKNFKYKLKLNEIENIKDEAARYLIPSSYCLSTFLTKVEEKDGATRFDFQYFLQRFVFASFF